jgi:hypothetical protein
MSQARGSHIADRQREVLEVGGEIEPAIHYQEDVSDRVPSKLTSGTRTAVCLDRIDRVQAPKIVLSPGVDSNGVSNHAMHGVGTLTICDTADVRELRETAHAATTEVDAMEFNLLWRVGQG